MIKERSALALHTDVPFNEVLSAAYMERQKMSVSVTYSAMSVKKNLFAELRSVS